MVACGLEHPGKVGVAGNEIGLHVCRSPGQAESPVPVARLELRDSRQAEGVGVIGIECEGLLIQRQGLYRVSTPVLLDAALDQIPDLVDAG